VSAARCDAPRLATIVYLRLVRGTPLDGRASSASRSRASNPATYVGGRSPKPCKRRGVERSVALYLVHLHIGPGGASRDKGLRFPGSRRHPESVRLLFRNDLNALPTLAVGLGIPTAPQGRAVLCMWCRLSRLPSCFRYLLWLAWLRFLRLMARDHGPEAFGQLATCAGTGFRSVFRPGHWRERRTEHASVPPG
jgi:hypothetical protein